MKRSNDFFVILVTGLALFSQSGWGRTDYNHYLLDIDFLVQSTLGHVYSSVPGLYAVEDSSVYDHLDDKPSVTVKFEPQFNPVIDFEIVGRSNIGVTSPHNVEACEFVPVPNSKAFLSGGGRPHIDLDKVIITERIKPPCDGEVPRPDADTYELICTETREVKLSSMSATIDFKHLGLEKKSAKARERAKERYLDGFDSINQNFHLVCNKKIARVKSTGKPYIHTLSIHAAM